MAENPFMQTTRRRHGPPCPLEDILENKLDPEQRDNLLAALADKDTEATFISRTLQADPYNFWVTDHQIRVHRNRQCNCARQPV